MPRHWEHDLSSWLVREILPLPSPQLARCPPMPSAWGGTEEKHLTSAAAVRVLERCLCGE